MLPIKGGGAGVKSQVCPSHSGASVAHGPAALGAWRESNPQLGTVSPSAPPGAQAPELPRFRPGAAHLHHPHVHPTGAVARARYPLPEGHRLPPQVENPKDQNRSQEPHDPPRKAAEGPAQHLGKLVHVDPRSRRPYSAG